MKVLLHCPNYHPARNSGGPVVSGHGLAKALARRSHEVQVFTTNVDGAEVLDVPLDRPVEMDGVRVRYFPVEAPRRLYHAPAMARALGEETARLDIVHTNGMYLWPGGRTAREARARSVPLVISPRGMLMPSFVAGRSSLLKRTWIACFERRNLAGAAAIHATSDEEAAGLRALGLDLAPVEVIGNGVDPPPAPSSALSSGMWSGIAPGRRVAFLGRLDRTKGVDLAIEACAAVPGARLLIAGPDQIGLRKGLEPRVPTDAGVPVARFVGPVEGARKWAFLAGADVLLAPSVNESFGLAVAEALSAGVPVICTEGVGAKTIVGKLDGECVVARDRRALARALRSLLDDPARRQRIGRRAAEVMRQDHGWDPVARRMERLYERARAGAAEVRPGRRATAGTPA